MSDRGRRDENDSWTQRSEYAGLLLEPANIFHNLIDVLGSYALDFRHIAKFPMVSANAVCRGQLKGRIAMMARLIDFVDQRRAMISPGSSLAVTHRATGVELRLTTLKLSGNRSLIHRLFRRGGIARR